MIQRSNVPSLYGFHYQVTGLEHYQIADNKWIQSWIASPPLTGVDMSITYVQLQEAHRARLETERPGISQQTLRNHMSVLNTYLSFLGKSAEHIIGKEILDDFNLRAKEFVEAACPGKTKTAADKMSILRAWRKSVETLQQVRKPRSSTPVARVRFESKFHSELRDALKRSGKSKVFLAHQIVVDISTIYSWLAGAVPNVNSSMPALRRLELELGLARGHLESLLPRPKRLPQLTKKDDAYTKRHMVNNRDRYLVRTEELTIEFKKEWFEFLRYKTTECPVGLKRSSRGRWQTLALNMVKPALAKEPWIQPTPGCASSTAQRAFLGIRAFFGFLRRPLSPSGDLALGGLGLPSAQIQSLAMFAVPEFVSAHFEFMKARAGGIVHTGHDVLAGFICSLLRPVEGYLAQQPEFRQKIEIWAKGRSWELLCAETTELCEKWQVASIGNKSREPKTPILPLLRLKSPLSPLINAINALDAAAAKMAAGGVGQARLKRNALLLAMSIANPLRERTFTICKYIPPEDDFGQETNLYQAETGEWRLRFSKDHFKNRKSRVENYDAPLPAFLNDRISEYLRVYRPVLIKMSSSCPWLFPSSQRGDNFSNLGVVLNNIAQRYIPEVSRLRTHAIRHIVATDFLAKNPEQYTVVAELLNDKLETVLENYAHCKQESSFRAHEKHLNNCFTNF